MKQPLYAILVAPDKEMREGILTGKKRMTIREGHRDYRPGPVILCCHLEPWAVMADITNVRHCTLADVAREEYQADGFNTRDDLLKGLQKYYPNLTIDSPVTIIR